MTWLLLAIVATLLRALYGVVTKVLSLRVKANSFTQAFLLTVSGLLISLCIAPLIGGFELNFSEAEIPIILIVALSQGFGNILYFAAIKYLTSSTAQIAFSSVILFNTLLALIFTQLSLTTSNILGIFLLITAIITATYGKIEIHKRGVYLMFLAAFLFAVFQISSGVIAKQVNPLTYLVISYLGASLVILCCQFRSILQDLRSSMLAPSIKISLMTGILSVGAFLFAYYAYREAPEPAKVAILLTAQVVVAVLLGYAFLRERNHLPRKLTAALGIVIATLLIKD